MLPLATTACRAPSAEAEPGSTPAMHASEPAALGTEPPPHPIPEEPREPTTRAPERPSPPAAPLAPAPLAPVVEPTPSEPATPEPATPEPAPPEPAPPEPARSKKACHRPSPHANGPLRDLVGLDEAAVRRCLGPPDRTSGSTWHYRWPKGCAYEVTRVVVRFARGTVARANAEHEITGQHCGSEL